MASARIAFKVVTEDLKSLGLRKNPNIMTFALGQQVHEPAPVRGNSDHGGIWCAISKSQAMGLIRYMNRKGVVTRLFECEVGDVLYKNSYRLKTTSVKLTKELKIK